MIFSSENSFHRKFSKLEHHFYSANLIFNYAERWKMFDPCASSLVSMVSDISIRFDYMNDRRTSSSFNFRNLVVFGHSNFGDLIAILLLPILSIWFFCRILGYVGSNLSLLLVRTAWKWYSKCRIAWPLFILILVLSLF